MLLKPWVFPVFSNLSSFPTFSNGGSVGMGRSRPTDPPMEKMGKLEKLEKIEKPKVLIEATLET